MRNFSEACLRNQQAIFEQLQPWLKTATQVLEIGSGSGQHAEYFCRQLPDILWQCSDRQMWLEALNENIKAMRLQNIVAPLELDVDISADWPEQSYDLIYTANSLHIMSWQSVENLFAHLPNQLQLDGYFCCYGPMKYKGDFTSKSNANFDFCLKDRDPQSGIRDIEALQALASHQHIHLVKDISMPANNQLLIWQKT